MAAVSLPAPGTAYGPCEEPCSHIDCRDFRAMAVTICRFCKKPIGYQRRFYNDNEHSASGFALIHAVCLEESVNA